MGRLIIAGLAGLVLAAAPAAAAPAKAAPTKAKAAAAKPAAKPASPAKKGLTAAALTEKATKGTKKPRVIDFEDETIRGTLTKPEGDIIGSRRRGKQRSLIKLRRHWVPELLKSADDL